MSRYKKAYKKRNQTTPKVTVSSCSSAFVAVTVVASRERASPASLLAKIKFRSVMLAKDSGAPHAGLMVITL